LFFQPLYFLSDGHHPIVLAQVAAVRMMGPTKWHFSLVSRPLVCISHEIFTSISKILLRPVRDGCRWHHKKQSGGCRQLLWWRILKLFCSALIPGSCRRGIPNVFGADVCWSLQVSSECKKRREKAYCELFGSQQDRQGVS
jgi:hypothetical protein